MGFWPIFKTTKDTNTSFLYFFTVSRNNNMRNEENVVCVFNKRRGRTSKSVEVQKNIMLQNIEMTLIHV